jgi:chromosome partitioning protein
VIITFTNTKGGTGKSNLSAHLAIWLYERGVNVALLDTDHEQVTSSTWIRRAEPGILVAVAGQPLEIKTKLSELAAASQVVVVDTPGSASPAAFTATLLADIAIVPLQPSESDVWAVDKALQAINVAREATDGRKPEAFIVLSCTALRDVQARGLRKHLEANLPYRIARSEIRRLFAFRAATGKSVTRMKGADAEKAQADLNALFCELLGGRLPGIQAPHEPSEIERRVVND